MCFSNQLTIHKVVIKVKHTCVTKNWQSNCNILNFYVSHSSATRFLPRCEMQTQSSDENSVCLSVRPSVSL